MNTTLRDYYVNLHDKDTFPHFDFSLRCWNQAIVENGTINGQLYLIAGDMNLSLFNTAMVLWQNVDLYDQMKDVENGDAESIQDLVMNYKWTYDVLYDWAGRRVLASDGTFGYDRYGLFMGGYTYPTQPMDALPYAWGLTFSNKEADGTYSFNFVGNEKAEKALIDTRNLWNQIGNVERAQVAGDNPNATFNGGGVVFSADVIYWNRASSNALREVPFKYALIPWPMYDENQETYYTTSQDYFTTMSVIDHSESTVPTKGEAVSAYLQYACEYSYDNVRAYYFHRIVKSKMLGTDDGSGVVQKSWTIFETIVNNLQFDFAAIYGQMLDHVLVSVWRTNVVYKDTNKSTSIESIYNDDPTFDILLQDLHVWFGLVEE